MVDHVIVLNISSTRTLTLNSLIFWSRPQTWFSRTSTVLDVGKWNYGNGNCPAKMKVSYMLHVVAIEYCAIKACIMPVLCCDYTTHMCTGGPTSHPNALSLGLGREGGYMTIAMY